MGGFGGSSQKQESQSWSTPAMPSAEESQARSMQNLINELQLQQSGYRATPGAGFDAQKYLAANPDVAADPYFSQNPYQHWLRHGQAEGRPGGPTEASLTQIPESEWTPEQKQQAAINQKIQDYVLGQIDQATNGPSPETRKIVGDIYSAQRTKGEQEISRFIGSEAAARGMNLSDTPILRELGLATTDLETGLRGAEASSLLNVGQANQTFAANLNAFQQNLRQQAYLNRLNLGASYGNMATNLASLRYGTAGRSSTGTGVGSSGANTMMGVGGLMQGAGSLFSSGSGGTPSAASNMGSGLMDLFGGMFGG